MKYSILLAGVATNAVRGYWQHWRPLALILWCTCIAFSPSFTSLCSSLSEFRHVVPSFPRRTSSQMGKADVFSYSQTERSFGKIICSRSYWIPELQFCLSQAICATDRLVALSSGKTTSWRTSSTRQILCEQLVGSCCSLVWISLLPCVIICVTPK